MKPPAATPAAPKTAPPTIAPPMIAPPPTTVAATRLTLIAAMITIASNENCLRDIVPY